MGPLQFSNASFLLNNLSLHWEAYVLRLEVYVENVPKMKQEEKGHLCKLLSKIRK